VTSPTRTAIGLAAVAVFLAPAEGAAAHPDHAHEEQAKDLSVSAKPRRVDRGERTQVRAVITPCVIATKGDVIQFRRGSAVFAEKPADADCTARAKSRVTRLTAFSAVSPEDLDSLSDTSNVVRVNVRRG
jgi:hypothetical protein